MHNKFILSSLLFSTSIAFSSVAFAGWKEGVNAYNSGNYADALTEFTALENTDDAKFVLYYLGDMHEKGLGVSKDVNKAVSYYYNSAKQGDDRSAVKIGTMYYFGNNVAQNFAEAYKWFYYAAKSGNATAEYNLGLMYFEGTGVNKDFKNAFYYLKRSADKGHSLAQGEIGKMLYEGKGAPQDYQEAIRYLLMAANQGNIDAQMNLGEFLSNQSVKGAPINFIHAHKWYNIAAAYGEEPFRTQATEKRDELVKKMDPAQIQEAQSLAGKWIPKTPEESLPSFYAEDKDNIFSKRSDKKNKTDKAAKTDKISKVDSAVKKTTEKAGSMMDKVNSLLDWDSKDSSAEKSKVEDKPKAESKPKAETKPKAEEKEAAEPKSTEPVVFEDMQMFDDIMGISPNAKKK
ncbi:MAG: SEL1-like repeat protein [Alphaproteobacteria bacterium]|nr:SEL1-like repeat protein [Alphaproteobacteria bacterium]